MGGTGFPAGPAQGGRLRLLSLLRQLLLHLPMMKTQQQQQVVR
jgi:hypothetical protein